MNKFLTKKMYMFHFKLCVNQKNHHSTLSTSHIQFYTDILHNSNKTHAVLLGPHVTLLVIKDPCPLLQEARGDSYCALSSVAT